MGHTFRKGPKSKDATAKQKGSSKQHKANPKNTKGQHRNTKANSTSSSPTSGKSVLMDDFDQAPAIRLDPKDPHYFHNYNQFGHLKVEGVNEESQLEDPVDIIGLIEQYEQLNLPSSSVPITSSSSRSFSSSPAGKAIVEPLSVTKQKALAAMPIEPEEINFRHINRQLKAFLRDQNEETLEIDPLPAVARKYLHEIAQCYQFKTVSHRVNEDRGSKDKEMKTMVIARIPGKSRMPADYKRVDRLIEQATRAMRYLDVVASHRRDWKPFAKRDAAFSKSNKSQPTFSSKSSSKDTVTMRMVMKPKEGTVVGSDAAPIGDDNVGMQLLKKLGWSPGSGLGEQSDGIKEPISAIVRTKRSGL